MRRDHYFAECYLWKGLDGFFLNVIFSFGSSGQIKRLSNKKITKKVCFEIYFTLWTDDQNSRQNFPVKLNLLKELGVYTLMKFV